MNKYSISIIFFLSLLLFACNASKNRCITIQAESIEIGDTFSISDFLVEDYDSFCLLPPYFNGNTEPIACVIPKDIKDKAIKRLRDHDNAFVMLFSKSGIVQSYSIIPRNDADFVKFKPLKGFSTKSKLTINSERQVEKVESCTSSNKSDGADGQDE